MSKNSTVAALGSLSPIAVNAHKYSRGSLVVLAGSARFPGAAVLAARAAERTGAGYTSLAIPTSAAFVAQSQLTSVPVVATLDTAGAFNANSWAQVKILISHIDAVVVGPGITNTAGTTELLRQLLRETGFPILMDADALNILAAVNFFNMHLSERHILTPHAGELKRLNAASSTHSAQELAIKTGAVVVEKGPVTNIFFQSKSHTVSSGTPALAKAGTGDVLSGIIGGLLAQGMQPYEAAIAGVELHAQAGCAAEKKYGTRSVIAQDVIDSIPEVLLSQQSAGLLTGQAVGSQQGSLSKAEG